MKKLFLLLSLFIVPVCAMEEPRSNKQELRDAIFDAIKKGDAARCRQLLNKENSIDGRIPVELCPNGFFRAAEKKPIIVKILLENGLNPNLIVNARNSKSPILISTIFGAHNHETIQLLLAYGADPKSYSTIMPPLALASNQKMYNALHQAAQKQCKKCCSMILESTQSKITPEQRSRVFTMLLCLNRISRDNRGIRNIYRNFQGILLPHLKSVFRQEIHPAVESLLRSKDINTKRACDYFSAYSELNPDNYLQSCDKHIK